MLEMGVAPECSIAPERVKCAPLPLHDREGCDVGGAHDFSICPKISDKRRTGACGLACLLRKIVCGQSPHEFTTGGFSAASQRAAS